MMGTVQQISSGINGAQWFLIVLIALVVIAIVIKLISVLVRTFSKQGEEISAEKAAQTQAAPASDSPVMAEADRQKLLAGISAALAEDMGTDISHLRIHSVRPVGTPAVSNVDRQGLMAAVSAAIAQDMGTDVSGLRIHAVRPLSAGTAVGSTSNQGLLAAIAATLAEDMGTDVSRLRIHAVRRV